MIAEIEQMKGELSTLLAAKESEFLLDEDCPIRIKNVIACRRKDVIAFAIKAEAAIEDEAVRGLVIQEYTAHFSSIRANIEKIKIK